MKLLFEPLPPKAPRRNGNAFIRWLARLILRVGGWHAEGQWPDVDKVVVIVAPHSSAWDGLWGLAMMAAMDRPSSVCKRAT